jgi:hypothetical protein
MGEGKELRDFAHPLPYFPFPLGRAGLHKHCPEQIQVGPHPFLVYRHKAERENRNRPKNGLLKTVNSLLT